jgi:hypothetical protein
MNILEDHKSGDAEFMNAKELTAGTDNQENMFSLSKFPWNTHGTYDDLRLRKQAAKVNKTKAVIREQQQQTQHLENAMSEGRAIRTEMASKPLQVKGEAATEVTST